MTRPTLPSLSASTAPKLTRVLPDLCLLLGTVAKNASGCRDVLKTRRGSTGFMIPCFALLPISFLLLSPDLVRQIRRSSPPKSRDDGGHPPLWLAVSPPLVKATVVFRSKFSSRVEKESLGRAKSTLLLGGRTPVLLSGDPIKATGSGRGVHRETFKFVLSLRNVSNLLCTLKSLFFLQNS